MGTYFRNNPAKFHPDPILNDRTLGFLKRSPQQEQEQEQQQDDELAIWDQWQI